MEKRRSIFVLAASSLAFLIPPPGRFIYGLVLVIELNLILLLGTLAYTISKKIKLESIKSPFIYFIVIATTILFRQILILIQPEIALTLGFVIYFIPISLFIIGYLFSNEDKASSSRIKFNFKHTITFSIFALLFFLVRDIFGYGTITFFGSDFSIVEKLIFSEDSISTFSVIASIPGALILTSIIIATHILLRNKINIIKVSEENKILPEENKKSTEENKC